jgi:hypothetical protein
MSRPIVFVVHAAFLVGALFPGTPAAAAAPRVLHTPGYQSPVQAGPDDVVVIVGADFAADDRVVYQAATAGATGSHPASVPTRSDAISGLAPVVAVAEPPYSLTARLPEILRKGAAYRLWVVDGAGEWSESITINDPRPSWITPGTVNETADPAGLGRRLRIVGRNLRAAEGKLVRVKLQGPATYILTSDGLSSGAQTSGGLTSDGPSSGEATSASAPASSAELPNYVAELPLPSRLSPGSYGVSLSTDGRSWVQVAGQSLQVIPDPTVGPDFAIDEPRFGGCRPGDGRMDNPCLARAIEAASQHGGGVVRIPAGIWDLSATTGLTLPYNVHLAGPAHHPATLVRHDARSARPRALLTVTGSNSITHLIFTEADTLESPADSRPVIALGEPSASYAPVTDVIISNNVFQRVGRAMEDTGRPLVRLMVTHNRFAAYDRDLQLPGIHINSPVPYRLEDSIIRWNTFLPGSFIDVPGHQGVIASELGGAERLDFSTNVADGTSTEGLQNSQDPKGWRAAFFWNLNGNEERMLISDNQVRCPGDKAGDGEALGFDDNGQWLAFAGAPAVSSAAADTVSVRAPLQDHLGNLGIERASYYRGLWVQVMEGPGTGQVRKIQSYVEDRASGTVTFTVAPGWDITPGPGSRISVGRDYWQVYAVGNVIDQRAPLCGKSNLNGPSGGTIAIWTSTADSVIAGNEQHDTGGIFFGARYSFPAADCHDCGNVASFQTGLEIRDNVVDGEYDWNSDCSHSGISGALSISPTPQSPPPLVGIGILIAHNRITHADGLRGGAIDLTAGWYLGPPPGKWPLLESTVIQHNTITDIEGPVPRNACHFNQDNRSAFRLDGVDNMRSTVFYANRCERVGRILIDGGKATVRLCPRPSQASCECAATTTP